MGSVEYFYVLFAHFFSETHSLPLDEPPLHSVHEAIEGLPSSYTLPPTRALGAKSDQSDAHTHTLTPKRPFWQKLQKCCCGENVISLRRAVEIRDRQVGIVDGTPGHLGPPAPHSFL